MAKKEQKKKDKKVQKNSDIKTKKLESKDISKKENSKKKKKKKKKNKIKEQINVIQVPVETKPEIDIKNLANTDRNAVFETFNRLINFLSALSNEPFLYNGNYIHQAEIEALEEISRSGPISLLELSNNLGISKSAVNKTITKLNHKNLIAKQRSETNPREINVIISDEGKKVLALEPTWSSRKKEPVLNALEKMNEQELAFFNAALERILVNTINK